MTVTNAQMITANAKRVAAAKIKPEREAEFMKTAVRLAKDKAKFEELSAKTGVPWAVCAVIKEREAGVDSGFLRNIAQGDPWSRKSVHVPAGRGPFTSWLFAGIDALVKCAPYASLWKDWSPGGTITILIKYNGTGYDSHGMVSPYGYGGTDQYVKGKYVADGKLDPNFVDPQLGCLGMLLALQKIDASAGFGPPVAEARPSPEPPKEIIDEATKGARKTRAGSIAGGAGAGGNEVAKTTATTEKPSSVPLLPSFVAYNLIGVAIVVAIIATVFIKRTTAHIKAIW
jgi:lysozyme family protein